MGGNNSDPKLYACHQSQVNDAHLALCAFTQILVKEKCLPFSNRKKSGFPKGK